MHQARGIEVTMRVSFDPTESMRARSGREPGVHKLYMCTVYNLKMYNVYVLKIYNLNILKNYRNYNLRRFTIYGEQFDNV